MGACVLNGRQQAAGDFGTAACADKAVCQNGVGVAAGDAKTVN